MLDVITTSNSFFKHVRDCGVTYTGMRSDHSAVRLTFSNRSFKFKSTYVERPVIDWKRIQDCEETNQLFNFNLQRKLKKNMSYILFNGAILNSAQQSAMINRQCKKGCFHHLALAISIISSTSCWSVLRFINVSLRRGVLISSYDVKNCISCC